MKLELSWSVCERALLATEVKPRLVLYVRRERHERRGEAIWNRALLSVGIEQRVMQVCLSLLR